MIPATPVTSASIIGNDLMSKNNKFFIILKLFGILNYNNVICSNLSCCCWCCPFAIAYHWLCVLFDAAHWNDCNVVPTKQESPIRTGWGNENWQVSHIFCVSSTHTSHTWKEIGKVGFSFLHCSKTLTISPIPPSFSMSQSRLLVSILLSILFICHFHSNIHCRKRSKQFRLATSYVC